MAQYAVPMGAKQRADVLVVERGLAPTRERARALILAGKVFSGEQRVDKAGDRLAIDAPLEVRGPDHPYVSRGGVKLAGALEAFAIDPAGLVVADLGASTGGFTDCLLQRGAARVYAVDVGWGQLHPKLRNDERVVVMERTNARHLEREDLPEAVDLVTVDASFIGLVKLLPPVRALLREGGEALALVKPQFEVGRDAVGKGGVVRDESARDAAVERVAGEAESEGFEVLGRVDSAIAGPKGNREVFLHLRKGSPDG